VEMVKYIGGCVKKTRCVLVIDQLCHRMILLGEEKNDIYLLSVLVALYGINLVVNGDAETGNCSTDSTVVLPTAWVAFAPITQLSYNNTISAASDSTPGPRYNFDSKLKIKESYYLFILAIVVCASFSVAMVVVPICRK